MIIKRNIPPTDFDAQAGPCDDATKMRLLYISGQRVDMARSQSEAMKVAKESITKLSKELDACVYLAFNNASIDTGIKVLQDKDFDLPLDFSFIQGLSSSISGFLSSWVPGIKEQSRDFEKPLKVKIRDYIYAEVQSGRKVNLISHSLGNIYTYQVLKEIHKDWKKEITWLSVGSPIDAAKLAKKVAPVTIHSVFKSGDAIACLGKADFALAECGPKLFFLDEHDFIDSYIPLLKDFNQKNPHVLKSTQKALPISCQTIFRPLLPNVPHIRTSYVECKAERV